MPEAKPGDRFRFCSLQTAFVPQSPAHLAQLLRAAPQSPEEGTLVRVAVPEGCESCGKAWEMYGRARFCEGRVLIPPYTAFTFQGYEKLDKRLGMSKN